MSDLHNHWSHRWVTPKAIPEDSDIEGKGVVATQVIEAGEPVGVLGGIIVPVSEISSYRREMGHAGIQINEEFFIVPSADSERHEQGIFNHSCNPNAGYRDSITLVAIRTINPEEEITFDYAFSETHFEPFECNCGADNCRGRVTPDDWKRPELQKKYKQYFSPYIRRKIEEIT